MIGLFLSEVILFIAAGLIGFAVGWRAFAMISGARAKAEERENDELRHLLTDAQVRRARGP
ncbi:MAG TPA: hypothetical protein VEA80_17210 [Vitreimonas sp.]|uniref:hypothetical protein n=1 Tax=Vitreimonas sp. TaxID=3069702 RepID=UPI002D666EA4|nr:hypothetical protein [Vitreimonas sp.]HYD89221.1 hypothetical protein [Vitreimonas sp.]